MNLEVWYSLSNTKITDLERLEDVIASLPYKQKDQTLIQTFCRDEMSASKGGLYFYSNGRKKNIWGLKF